MMKISVFFAWYANGMEKNGKMRIIFNPTLFADSYMLWVCSDFKLSSAKVIFSMDNSAVFLLKMDIPI